MKKIYEKPKVTKVELRPEEAALTACKVTGSGIGCACFTNPSWGGNCLVSAS